MISHSMVLFSRKWSCFFGNDHFFTFISPTPIIGAVAEDRKPALFTFLFTDIEGSTSLWEQYPDAMRSALAVHDALLRGSMDRHGGKIFKTVGDAFYAVFAEADAALAACVEAQRALYTQKWEGIPGLRVRMALNTGAAEERDGDYFGPVLNRLSRLMAAGHGGQTLLTLSTKEALQRIPSPVELRDMGERRLRDLSRPEHIFQVLVPDLPADFPPLATLEAIPNNLPSALTTFVGREGELADVKRLLSTTHLLTLTGSGGCGKTRLSLQVAAELLDTFTGGVWFVELAPLSDPATVPSAIATALGVREDPSKPVLNSIADRLHDKTALLILDNCEHLISAVAEVVNTLLRACPNLRIIGSSREALGISGETVWNYRDAPGNSALLRNSEITGTYLDVRSNCGSTKTHQAELSGGSL
jgi:class 3 adenylate cyclase